MINDLIIDLASTPVPAKYHENEDALAEYVIQTHKWPIKKEGNKWVGEYYPVILEQGGFKDLNQNPFTASGGRKNKSRDQQKSETL